MQIRFGLSALLVSAAPAALFVCVPAVLAQAVPVVSRPVVQALPSADTQRLNSALARVARDPRDYLALIDAGDAANAMGDPEAAAGFYKRAEGISPGHVRIKAGLGRALVLQGKAAEAIPMFASAEAGGATVDVTSDRGLAYDLVGDPVTAQRYYRTAMARRDDDEVRRRLGVSLVIAGDAASGEAMLMPLLRKQDKPAWRAHAFALAIAGKTKEAVDTVNAILPPPLAQSVTPYLRYMPRLTRAQQAAAVNLGQFPRASEIGRDDPAIAAFAPTVTRVATADAALIPRGKPFNAVRRQTASGTKAAPSLTASEKRAQDKAARLAKVQATKSRVAPPEPKPTISRISDGELPALAKAAPMAPLSTIAPAAKVDAKPVEPVVGVSTALVPAALMAAPQLATAIPGPTNVPVQTAPVTPSAKASSSFDLAKVSPPTVVQPTATAQASVAPLTPVSSEAAAPQSAPQWAKDILSLEQAFANLGAPSRAPVPIAGAVDVRSIKPAKLEPETEVAPDPAILKAKLAAEALAKDNAAKEAARSAAAKKAAAAKAAEAKKIADAKKAEAAKIAEAKAIAKRHPSRIWVQVGVGRDKSAIAFDWRRSTRENPEIFKGRNPYINQMGRTNRILIGPFASSKAAAEMVAKVKKAGVGGAYAWTSAVGEEVDALVVK